MGNNPSLFQKFGKNQFQEGSVVVITGAGSGMGRELAMRYAKRNCKVVIADIQLNKLKEVQQDCLNQFNNPDVIPVLTDVSNEEQTQNLIETAISNFGKIDLLMLCAGISAHCLFEDFKSMDPFRKVVEINLYGCVYPTRHALKYLKKNSESRLIKNKGHIVVFSSFSGEFGLPYRSCYSASKFAVNGFFESLRMEIGDEIDITIISPITVQTEFRQNSLIKSEQKASEAAEGSSITAEEAVNQIIVAADYRIPKFVFPFKPWVAVLLKNIAPKQIENIVKAKAKM